MKQIISKLLIGLALMAGFVVVVGDQAVLAQSKQDICEGVGIAGGNPGDNCAEGALNVTTVVRNVINILSLVVGIAAVFMIIIGGFKYITSSGDSNSINGAKNTILFAIVGLVVVALAQVIVRFVLNRATEVTP